MDTNVGVTWFSFMFTFFVIFYIKCRYNTFVCFLHVRCFLFFVTVAARILPKSLYVSAHKALLGKSCVSCVKGPMLVWCRYQDGYEKTGVEGGSLKPGLRRFKKTGYPGGTFMLVNEHGWKMPFSIARSSKAGGCSMAVANGSSKDRLTGPLFCSAPRKMVQNIHICLNNPGLGRWFFGCSWKILPLF